MSGFCSLPSHPVNIKFTNLFGKYTGQHMANIYEGWSRFEQEGSLTLPEFQKMIDNLAGNDFKNASIVGRVLNNDTAKGFTSFMVEGIDSRAMNEATVLGVDFVDKATMWTIANSQEFINEFGNWKPAFLALKEGHKRTLVRGRQYSRGMIGKLYPNGEPRVAYLIKFLYEKTKTPEQKAEAVQYFKQAMKSVVGDAYNESLGTIDPNMTEDHRIYEWAEIINGLGGEYTVRILPQTTVEAQRRYVQRLKNYDFISDKRMPELEKSKSFFYTIPKILSDEVVATSRGEWDGYVPTQLDHEKFHVLEEKLRKETGGTMGVKRSKDGTGDAYMFAVDKATLNETEGMKISKDKFQYQRVETIKEGIPELFESNPELSSIGTQEQYSQYLNTIFPDSKVVEMDNSLYISVLNQLEQENKIEKDCTGVGKLKAKDGITTLFEKGGKWELVTDFKNAPTHKAGGKDISIQGKKVEIEKNELRIENDFGDVAVIPSKYRVEVKDAIKSNCHSCIDNIVESLPKMKDYAGDGTVFPFFGRYKRFKNSLPSNLKNTSEDDYAMRYYWKHNNKPKSFDEAINRERPMFTMEDDGYYHAPSVEPNTLRFLKPKNHPTLQYELDWYNSDNPDAVDFKSKYDLDTSGKFYKYVPKKK